MVRCGGRFRYEASDNACLIRSRGWQPRSAIFAGAVVVDQQSLDEAALRRRAEVAAAAREDRLELLDGRTLGEDLVLNAPQERLVDEFGRPNVGREDDQRHERQLELLAALQRQEVHAALERHDPPVQQVARRARAAGRSRRSPARRRWRSPAPARGRTRSSGCSSTRATRA